LALLTFGLPTIYRLMEINKILSATEVKGAYFENMVSSCEQRKEIVSRNLKHCCSRLCCFACQSIVDCLLV
jgi:hypothetical protein